MITTYICPRCLRMSTFHIVTNGMEYEKELDIIDDIKSIKPTSAGEHNIFVFKYDAGESVSDTTPHLDKRMPMRCPTCMDYMTAVPTEAYRIFSDLDNYHNLELDKIGYGIKEHSIVAEFITKNGFADKEYNTLGIDLFGKAEGLYTNIEKDRLYISMYTSLDIPRYSVQYNAVVDFFDKLSRLSYAIDIIKLLKDKEK